MLLKILSNDTNLSRNLYSSITTILFTLQTKMHMKSYIIKIISISIIIAILALAIFYFIIPQYYLPVFPAIILFFIATSIFVHVFLTKAGKKNMRQFSTYFMGSIGIKLFIYMIFIIVYSLIDKENIINFVSQFFILYIIYTFFETTAIMKTLNNQDNNNSENN